jgi:polyferredoxin
MSLRPGQFGLRLVPTLGLAFVAYELTLFVFSRVTGWACPFTVDVVAAVATHEALWFAGLGLTYVGLGRVLPSQGAVTRQPSQ